MKASGSKSLPAIGFLTVVDDPQYGLFGGYLILNTVGRPLQFHCTSPVKPNRAQEILYGPTLREYLYGEQIGRTLVAKATITPLIVCTDTEPVLAVRDFVALPIVFLVPAGQAGESASEEEPSGRVRIDQAEQRVPAPKSAGLIRFRLGRHNVAVAAACPGDRDAVAKHWHRHADSFDLAEPFDRIRAAIEEARPR